MNPNDRPRLPYEIEQELSDMTPEERRALEQVWILVGRTASEVSGVPDTQTAWERLEAQIETPPAEHGPARRTAIRPPVRRKRRVLRPAAAVAVLTLGILLLWWRQPVVLVVPAGAQETVALPDGSTVQMNSGTRLRYVRRFQTLPFVSARRRAVELEGEAYFEVVHSKRPFVVETSEARIEVLGTRFNVRARAHRSDSATRVTIASGRIRVVPGARPEDAVVLSQEGEAVRISTRPDGRTTLVRRANLDVVLAWRNQGFAVTDMTLREIFDEIERRYDLSIEAGPGIALPDSMNLFYLRGTTAEEIIHDLCLSQGCRYRKTSRGFELFKTRERSGP